MTRTTNARLAGSVLLLYIAMGIGAIVLTSPVGSAEGIAAKLAGFLKGPVTSFMWPPMLVFEVVLALWLLIKGVAMPATQHLIGETS